MFNDKLAPLAQLLFFRSYSRMIDGIRESAEEVFLNRTIEGLLELGDLTSEELDVIKRFQGQLKVLTSGRGLFVQGTDAAKKEKNVYSHYNCSNVNVESWYHFGLLMNMAMQGTGTGAKLEPIHINKIPTILNELTVEVKDEIGSVKPEDRLKYTQVKYIFNESNDEELERVEIYVGDSREGWVKAYEELLALSSKELGEGPINVHVYVGNVRPKNEPLKGFGGVSNPTALPQLFSKCAAVLNKARGRKLNSVECCKLIDEAAVVIVAGNIRRCLPKGSLVTTPNGSVPIEQIGIGDEVLTTKGLKKVSDIFHQGKQSLMRISIGHRYIKCSSNHKIATSDESSGAGYRMIPAKELKVGQLLLVNLLDYLFKEEECLSSSFYLGQFKRVLSEPLTLQFFDSLDRTELEQLLKDKDYSYELEVIGNGNEPKRALLTINDFNRLNDEPHTLNVLESLYGKLIGASVLKVPIKEIIVNTDKEEDTFDIEVEDQHEFFCEGVLVSNSAGMRMGASDDELFATAKDNLWIQDTDGNWKIDPERDALRMANHTRVYKHKPTYEECLAAVTKQYHSGEGAIQWAGEAIARANADLLNTRELKQEFLDKYSESHEEAIKMLLDIKGDMNEREIEHRMGRYSLNPCLAAGTMVLTSKGRYPIESLVGQEVEIWDGNVWITIDNFRVTGENQEVWKLVLDDEEVIATPSHTFLVKDGGRVPLYELREGMELLGMIKDHTVMGIEHSHIADKVYCCTVPTNNTFALGNGLLVGNCGEIIGNNLICNLGDVHLNLLDPLNIQEQKEAFNTAGLMVAVLLNHKFPDEIMQYSREIDPIVGVSFNGLFDFFVKALGTEWLRWWTTNRDKDYLTTLEPGVRDIGEALGIDIDSYKEGGLYRVGQLFYDIESTYLSMWKDEAFAGVYKYCDSRGLKRPNRTTCTQPGGCCDRSLLRVMDQGLIYMDEVMEDGEGDVVGLGLSVRNGLLADKGIANEPMNLVKITLNNGRILRLTPDHRLSVDDCWLSTNELMVGMSLDYRVGTYESNVDYPLVKIDFGSYTKYNLDLSVGEYKKGYIKTISQPDSLTPSLGYMLGALYGNGCCDKRNRTGRMRFTHERMEVLNKIQDISEQLFGFRGSVSTSSTSIKKLELVLSSTLLYDWMTVNQLIKKEKSKELDRIPLPIRCSSKETILSFFCGLIDTDGCIRANGSLTIDSASEAFLRNLQQIGEAVGLSFSIFHNSEGKNLQGQKDMWGLYLSRMLSTPEAIQYINTHSIKAEGRPIPLPKKQFKFNPYEIISIEYETTPDYSFDITVEGKDDDDSWYWQGAIKSHNSKSLLTGASSGWHPPKAPWFIRRMTFRREDPIALAAIDYGYTVVPSQSNKDEEGNLLNDPYDPRVDEWLVEVPVEVSWANKEGITDIDISKLSAIAQLKFYMNVQRSFVSHNASGTIEFTEREIEDVARYIYEAIQNDEGYISVALLQRFDNGSGTFPRLPMEPIDKETYDELRQGVLERRKTDDFKSLLDYYTQLSGMKTSAPQDSACEGIICEIGNMGPTNK